MKPKRGYNHSTAAMSSGFPTNTNICPRVASRNWSNCSEQQKMNSHDKPEKPLWSSRTRTLFRTATSKRRCLELAKEAHAGRFGTRAERYTGHPVAAAFWRGYDDAKPVPPLNDVDPYVAYRLGRAVAKQDEADALATEGHRYVAGHDLTADKADVYDAMPPGRWVEAGTLAPHLDLHVTAIGRILFELARLKLIERRHDIPPSYRKP